MIKLEWGKDHKSVILTAQTKGEVAFCEILVEGMNAHQYASSETSAKFTIIPEELEL